MVDFSSRWLRVAVAGSSAGPLRDRVGPWRVDQYMSTTSHERCVAAVGTFATQAADAHEQEGGALRLLLLGKHAGHADLQVQRGGGGRVQVFRIKADVLIMMRRCPR